MSWPASHDLERARSTAGKLAPAIAALLLIAACGTPPPVRPAAPTRTAGAPGPVRVHPRNPRYLEWRGRAVVLVASGEHYGSVVNPQFAYARYLDTIAAEGLNHTRLFLGDYIEDQSMFGMLDNPLQPAAGTFLAPWARSAVAGSADGGNRFDLDRWNPDYFARLHDFMGRAEARGIVVEAVVFFVGPGWKRAPFNPRNNVNGTSDIPANQVLTLDNGNLLARQEAWARKLARELNRYDNVILNLCNEPWFVNGERPGFTTQPSAATKAWLARVARWVRSEEETLPKRHVLSVDISNRGTVLRDEDLRGALAEIDMFNVHYDSFGRSLLMNRHVARPLAFNETGFQGTDDGPYRADGWRYLLMGGALYGNLDFSFTVGHEDGTAQPRFKYEWYDTGGSATLRKQLAILLRFMNELPLADMAPDDSFVVDRGGAVEHHALSAPGRAHAVWFPGDGPIAPWVDIAAGTWRSEWVNTLTGAVEDAETFTMPKPGAHRVAAHTRRGGGGALRVLRQE